MGCGVLLRRATAGSGGRAGAHLACAARRVGSQAVRYAATVPGIYGDTIALVAELAISFILMYAILFASGHEVLAPYTHYFARLAKEIMRRVRSTSTSRRDAGCRQSACLEETCRPRQGRVVDFACLDGFVQSDNGEDIQLELFLGMLR